MYGAEALRNSVTGAWRYIPGMSVFTLVKMPPSYLVAFRSPASGSVSEYHNRPASRKLAHDVVSNFC
ncbi:hypothetical protein PANT111_40173 [Pantoea brenneri]|uniref:Uncharacterized protein n=1 Tax=Pantoea brenneri TaxID=472694 RepID=A0AAX3JAJ9_9GAMM|nr:hypothetical protein PANT111_40173 [Pantoea brenneri]